MVTKYRTHPVIIKVVLLFLFISGCSDQLPSPEKSETTLNSMHKKAHDVAVDYGINFALVNTSEKVRREVMRVSLPVGQSSTNYKPANWLIVDGKQTQAQVKIITSYQNGSPRRIMLTFPAQLEPQQNLSCQYDPWSVLPVDSPLEQSDVAVPQMNENGSHVFSFPSHGVSIIDDQLILTSNSNGHTLAILKAYGPELADPQPPNTIVIETGTFLTWLRWTQHGSNYSREVDFQVDCLDHIKMTQRILRHLPGNDWTPDFGFKLTATEAEPVRVPAKPIHFLHFNPESTFGEHPELITSLQLANDIILSMANCLALRQNRGTLEAEIKSEKTTVIRTGRIEPIENENNKLMIQEGMWRVTEVVLYPEDPDILALSIDQPLVTKIDWRAYDAVYNSGPPLQAQHPLLNKMIQRAIYVLKKMSINGDDWGNMTSYDPATDTATVNSMLRFNHCQYVWEDYFRTGDPQLSRIAIDWSENYRNFSVYWGPKERYFGGGRNGGKNPRIPGLQHGPGTYMERENNAVHFCTKGYHNFWLTYEETGDPRFKEAAEAQAKWSAEYVHTNTGEMRNIGIVSDYVKLYEYTGESFYLDQAIRLWEEFMTKQCPDLLFTQHGGPATGSDLFIRDDEHGYQNPFYKAYMVQYATNSLPYLLKHRPDDQILRDTILACNNWMPKVQTPGGGWGYPGPTSPRQHLKIEYSHGLMVGHKISPNEAYLDTVQHALNPIIALYEKYGCLPFFLVGWEQIQNQEDLLDTYKLGADRNRLKDFTHGSVEFRSLPDTVVYLQVVLRDYLNHRSEDSLLTKDKFVKQILQLPSNLPKERVRYDEQDINSQIINTLASEPILSLPEAASIGDVNLVKLLIENGAEVNGKEDSFFKMALHRAALGGHKDVVELLIMKGADVNTLDSFHGSSLHYAVERGHKEIAELLIANGSDVNVKDEIGQTPFDIALSQNRKEIAELLINSGADVDLTKQYPNGDTPLLYTIKAGRKGIAELLIAEGADVNAKDKNGQTTLYIAVSNDNKEIVKLLIDEGADVNAKNENGQTPLDIILSRNQFQISRNQNHAEIRKLLLANGAEILSIHAAVQSGDLEKVKAFLEQGIDINSKDGNGDTPLHIAVARDNNDITVLLIDNEADVNAMDKNNYTPLYDAIWNSNKDMVSFLVSKGADVNFTPEKDYSPLHYAVWMEDFDIVKLFVDKGAKFDTKVLIDEMTALHYTALQGSMDMIELFISKGIDTSSFHMAACAGDLTRVKELIEQGTEVDQKDEAGWTALFWAVSTGQTEVAEFLIDNNADLSVNYGRGQSLLHLAAQTDSVKLVELLIAKGADVNTKNQAEATPIFNAASAGHLQVVELLVSKGADVNAKNRMGQTPLHSACGSGYREVAEFLINKGADVNAKTEGRIQILAGRTPLYSAVMSGSKEIVELLIDRGADVTIDILNLAEQRGQTEIVELLEKQMQVHDVGVTSMAAPKICICGDTVPIKVSVANESSRIETIDVRLMDSNEDEVIGDKSITLSPAGMDKVADVIFTGETPGPQQLGNYLYSGDVNGDGYGDLLVAGASRYDNCRGRVYLHFGGPDMDNLPEIILTGEKTDDYLGEAASIGDINGDKYPDVVVGAPGYNNWQGRVYILYGGTDMDAIPDLIINGLEGTADRFGRTITVADMNKDGFVDVFVTADYASSKRGQVFLFYGGNPMDIVADKIFYGEDANDRFGLRMTAGGDVNGDGYDDVIIGAEYAPNGDAKGKSYLFYGASGTTMDTIPDEIFVGDSNQERFGNSQFLADIDKDGFDDVMVGGVHWRSQGRVYLYWGNTETRMDVNADVIFTGEMGSRLGDYIVCGYFNGDDYLDIVAGAYTYLGVGKVCIFNGNRREDIDTICDFTLIGEDKDARFGNMLTVGDFNGDDADDLAVGGWGYNNAQGRCWLYYGNPNDTTDITFNWDTTNATPGKHVLKAAIAPVTGEEDTADNNMVVEVEVREKTVEKR